MCSEKGKSVLSAQLVLLGQLDYCISIYALSAHGKVVNNFNFFVGGKARGIIMKKLLSVFLSLTMLISSAAVMSVPVGAASKTGKKYVTYKTKKKTVKKSGVLILSGSIKYPKLKSKSKAAKKVNKTIKKMVKKDAKYITDLAYKDYKKADLQISKPQAGIMSIMLTLSLLITRKVSTASNTLIIHTLWALTDIRLFRDLISARKQVRELRIQS